MTNLDNLISAFRDHASRENDLRFGGRAQLKVDAPKYEPYELQGRVNVPFHSDIENDVCVYTDASDENRCAAYLYLCQRDDHFVCTLRLANEDGAHHEPMQSIPCSLDDQRIAETVIASVIAGTRRFGRRSTESDRGVPFSELVL